MRRGNGDESVEDAVARRVDSDTIRMEEGSMRFEFDGPEGCIRVDVSRLGKPRAAAAQERRVDRDARKAAS